MFDYDDTRFSSFTRDLARRHRRPRSYPPPPPYLADALEHLCGAGSVARQEIAPSLARWPQDLSEIDRDHEDEPT